MDAEISNKTMNKKVLEGVKAKYSFILVVGEAEEVGGRVFVPLYSWGVLYFRCFGNRFGDGLCVFCVFFFVVFAVSLVLSVSCYLCLELVFFTLSCLRGDNICLVLLRVNCVFYVIFCDFCIVHADDEESQKILSTKSTLFIEVRD